MKLKAKLELEVKLKEAMEKAQRAQTLNSRKETELLIARK